MAGVAVDREDHVFVYSRSRLPIVVLDREGTFVRGWGNGEFVRPHGIHVGADGSIWCIDDEGQRVVRYTLTGERLEVIVRENRLPRRAILWVNRAASATQRNRSVIRPALLRGTLGTFG